MRIQLPTWRRRPTYVDVCKSQAEEITSLKNKIIQKESEALVTKESVTVEKSTNTKLRGEINALTGLVSQLTKERDASKALDVRNTEVIRCLRSRSSRAERSAHGLGGHVASLSNTCRELKEKLNKSDKKNKVLSHEKTATISEVITLSDEVARLEKGLHGQSHEISYLLGEKKHAEDRISKLEAQNTELSRRNADLSLLYEELLEESHSLEDKNVSLTNNFLEHSLTVQTMENMVSALKTERDGITERFYSDTTLLRNRVNALQSSQTEGDHTIINLQGEVRLLSDQRDIIVHWYEKTKAELQELQGRLPSPPKRPRDKRFPSPSFIIVNRWRVTKLLGEGGYGAVYQAEDTYDNNRIVALKIELLVEGREHGFRTEMQVYSAFPNQDPNDAFMPTPEQALQLNNEYGVIVMNCLGPSVEEQFQKFHFRFTLTGVVRFAVRALTALERFHNNGFVHRDVKPGNFLTDSRGSGRVYLSDFGLSRRYASWDNPPAGKVGSIVTTPRYASMAAHRMEHQSRASDLESLGYVLWELVCGELAWDQYSASVDPEVLNQVVVLKQRSLHRIRVKLPWMNSYFEYLQGLTFSTRPDYEYLRRLLERQVSGSSNDVDWVQYR